jgi:fatty acid desaturase
MTNRTENNREDQIQLHAALVESKLPYSELRRKNGMHVLLDIAFDWFAILASTYLVWRIGFYIVPAAIIFIGNRQRAMGNLLHDAGHRNLFRSNKTNDFIAGIFLAPALFNDLKIYRKLHLLHHSFLGDPQRDPDYITPAQGTRDGWWPTYFNELFSFKSWRGSVIGHLASPNMNLARIAHIILWWFVVLSAIAFLMGAKFTLIFCGLWLLSRASTFHAITIFREMCDHFGLEPGGIFSFTRDISIPGPWRCIIHPRNNSYHLTHHLMPMVPYHNLHMAHKMLIDLPYYRERAECCQGYFFGKSSVIKNNKQGEKRWCCEI